MNDSSSVNAPASLRAALLIGSWAEQWFQDGINYAGAAQVSWMDCLFKLALHTSDWAISH
jgi:hypothetical protein